MSVFKFHKVDQPKFRTEAEDEGEEVIIMTTGNPIDDLICDGGWTLPSRPRSKTAA